jgi:hypothetical protein
MLRRQTKMGSDNTSFVSSLSSSSSRPGRTELGSVSSVGNLKLRNPASELHSNSPAHELDSGISASELGSSSKPSPNLGAGK